MENRLTEHARIAYSHDNDQSMNRAAKAVDWAGIEAECRNSTLAITAIARKHQISYDSVRKRADRGGWRRKVVVRWVDPSPREAKEPDGAPDWIPGDSDFIGSPEDASTDAGGGEIRPRANAPDNGDDGRIGDMRDPVDPRAILDAIHQFTEPGDDQVQEPRAPASTRSGR